MLVEKPWRNRAMRMFFLVRVQDWERSAMVARQWERWRRGDGKRGKKMKKH
jgi:hypothetical protein